MKKLTSSLAIFLKNNSDDQIETIKNIMVIANQSHAENIKRLLKERDIEVETVGTNSVQEG